MTHGEPTAEAQAEPKETPPLEVPLPGILTEAPISLPEVPVETPAKAPEPAAEASDEPAETPAAEAPVKAKVSAAPPEAPEPETQVDVPEAPAEALAPEAPTEALTPEAPTGTPEAPEAHCPAVATLVLNTKLILFT